MQKCCVLVVNHRLASICEPLMISEMGWIQHSNQVHLTIREDEIVIARAEGTVTRVWYSNPFFVDIMMKLRSFSSVSVREYNQKCVAT